MQITIDTNNLSEMDINMLAFLAEQGEPAEAETESDDEAEEPADEPEPEPKPAKKASKKAATKKAKPEPEPEPESDEDDSDGPTMSDAVAAATQLVSSGEAARVKAALAEVGAKRVSEMDEGDIPAFLAALEDES